MTEEIDKRAQFVGTLKGDHILPDGAKASDGSQVFVSIETKWNDNTKLYGPMPSPVALFLNSAIRSYNTANELRNTFKFNDEESSFISISSKFYDYIEAFFESVIFSATSLETFCNVHIDDDQTYQVSKTKCTEIYQGEQIERWVSLDDKLTKIVAPKLGASLDKSTLIWSDYKNLITTRDRLVHLKNRDRGNSSLNDETVWSLVATETIINPPKITINLMEQFYVNATVPDWFTELKQKL